MKKLTHGNSLSASPNYEQHNIYNSVVTNFILCSNELLRNSEFHFTALIDRHQAINFWFWAGLSNEQSKHDGVLGSPPRNLIQTVSSLWKYDRYF